MYIFPAIDLYGGKAVRLQRGDYNKMTVYSDYKCDDKDYRKKGRRIVGATWEKENGYVYCRIDKAC